MLEHNDNVVSFFRKHGNHPAKNNKPVETASLHGNRFALLSNSMGQNLHHLAKLVRQAEKDDARKFSTHIKHISTGTTAPQNTPAGGNTPR